MPFVRDVDSDDRIMIGGAFIEAGRIGSATLAGRSIPVTAGDVFLRDVV